MFPCLYKAKCDAGGIMLSRIKARLVADGVWALYMCVGRVCGPCVWGVCVSVGCVGSMCVCGPGRVCVHVGCVWWGV